MGFLVVDEISAKDSAHETDNANAALPALIM